VSLLDRDRVLTSGTVARAVDTLAGRALAYGGSVRCRHNRIRLQLGEPIKAMQTYRVPSGASMDQMTPPAVS
ncbi:MAG: hypothetical protein ACREO8_00190, partial [Luteimonas sp.]